MRLTTTCASCGQQLLVARHDQQVHEHCPPSPRPADQLAAAFLAAAEAGRDDDADQLAEDLDGYHRRPPDLLGAALAYTAWGWPVFPCRPRGKTPLIARAAGGHGLHDATTEEEVIRGWWAATPTANVGLPTGGAFDVLDVDPGGLRIWADLRTRHTHLDIHGQVSTPRGGLHLYLQPRGSGNLAGFHPGLDFRGAGGYVLAPPSVLGRAALAGHPVPPWPLRYSWLVYPSPTLTGQDGGRR